jgi:hypothetical protein
MDGIWSPIWADIWGAIWGGGTDPTPTPVVGGVRRRRRIPVPDALALKLAQQLIAEDELLISMAGQIAASGLLTGSTNGKS